MEIFKLFGSIFVDSDAADKSIKKTGENAEGFAAKLGNGIKKAAEWGAAVAAAAAAAAAAIATKAVAAASEFEESFAKVNTLLSDTTNLADYKKAIIDLSSKTGVAAAELSESVYSAISASVDQAKAVDFVASAIKLAKGGFTDATTAVDIMTTAINAYGMSAEDAAKVSDYLITTQNLGKTTVAELASSMGKVIPTAKAQGVAMDTLCGAYAVMTANGVATAETTTYLNSMLNELGKQGTKAAKAFAKGTSYIKKGGLTMAEAMEQGWDLTDVLSILDEQACASGTSIANMFGSAEAGKAANVLWDNAQKLNGAIDGMGESAGATEKAYEIMHNTFAARIEYIKNAAENAMIEIGDTLLPAANGLLDWVMENMPVIQETIQTVIDGVRFVIEAFCGVAQDVFSRIESALDEAGVSFDDVMSGIQELFAGVWEFLLFVWDGVGQPLLEGIIAALVWLHDNWAAISDAICNAFGFLWSAAENIWNTIGRPLFDGIVDGMSWLSEHWEEVSKVIQDTFEVLWDVCCTLWDTIGQPVFELIGYVIEELAGLFNEHLDDILAFFRQAMEGIRDTWENHLKPVFDAIGKFLKEVLVPVFKFVFQTVIKPLVEHVFDVIGKLWNKTLKPVFDGICDFLLGVFTSDWKKALEGILNIVTGIFDGIRLAVEKPMDMVRDIVEKAINFILDKFDFDWELPHLKLPHFSINGSFSLNPPSVPSLGIDWYAKGGVLEEPTIFGMNPENGNAMVGGEAGPEAVAPIETLQQYVGEAVAGQNAEMLAVLYQILQAILAMDAGLLEKMIVALEAMRFDMNHREFARMVREVYA